MTEKAFRLLNELSEHSPESTSLPTDTDGSKFIAASIQIEGNLRQLISLLNYINASGVTFKGIVSISSKP